MTISYKHGNNSVIHAQLFRSYREGKQTTFQCAAYECQYSEDILAFAKDLKGMENIKCFYHPEKPAHVYMHSGSNNSGLVIFFFTFELFLVIILTAVQIILMIRCFCGSKVKCKGNAKGTVKEEAADTFAALKWILNYLEKGNSYLGEIYIFFIVCYSSVE